MNALTNLKLLFKLSFLLTLLFFISNAVLAASQGKKGKSSSGSVEISVYVSQTLNTVSPNELILSQGNNLKTENSEPFCIAHHGFNQNASVPYNLNVRSLSSANPEHRFAYKVFLEDKNEIGNRLYLATGMSIYKQSTLSVNQELRQNCVSSGLSLSVEMNEEFQNHSHKTISPGLMVLMVGPI